jgi:hypothetical protein
VGAVGIEWIAADSPQAKGRIERLFATLQDRLVKEKRLAGIGNIAAANHFLEMRFLPAWEERFTVAPRRPHNAHRRLDPEQRLEEILSVRVGRQVADDRTVSWDGHRWGVPREEVCAGLRGAQVEPERRLDGSHWLRFRGRYFHLRHCPAAAPRAVSPCGLQDSPPMHSQKFTKALLQTTHAGHFNMTENRTFLLCVDTVLVVRVTLALLNWEMLEATCVKFSITAVIRRLHQWDRTTLTTSRGPLLRSAHIPTRPREN